MSDERNGNSHDGCTVCVLCGGIARGLGGDLSFRYPGKLLTSPYLFPASSKFYPLRRCLTLYVLVHLVQISVNLELNDVVGHIMAKLVVCTCMHSRKR